MDMDRAMMARYHSQMSAIHNQIAGIHNQMYIQMIGEYNQGYSTPMPGRIIRQPGNGFESPIQPYGGASPISPYYMPPSQPIIPITPYTPEQPTPPNVQNPYILETGQLQIPIEQ